MENNENRHDIPSWNLPWYLKHMKSIKNSVGSVIRNVDYLYRMFSYAHQSNNEIDSDEIDETCMTIVRDLNYASRLMQYIIREYDPDIIFSPYSAEWRARKEDGYDVISDESGMYVKTPLAPVAAYKNIARKQRKTPFSMGNMRYGLLTGRVVLASEPRIIGPLSVYILHVYHDTPKYRKSPDFDNYDLKNLLDTVLDLCGGDSVNNVSVMNHEATVRTDVDEGTYLAVRPVDFTLTFEQYRNGALEHFRKMNLNQDNYASTDV